MCDSECSCDVRRTIRLAPRGRKNLMARGENVATALVTDPKSGTQKILIKRDARIPTVSYQGKLEERMEPVADVMQPRAGSETDKPADGAECWRGRLGTQVGKLTRIGLLPLRGRLEARARLSK